MGVDILLSMLAFLGVTPGQVFLSEPLPLLSLPGCSQWLGSAGGERRRVRCPMVTGLV
jgi:hypothetical protein